MASKKQRRIVADQIARGMNYFAELDIPFALCFEGINKVYSNSDPLHADAILDRQWRFKEKLLELKIEKECERMTAIPTSDGDEPLAH